MRRNEKRSAAIKVGSAFDDVMQAMDAMKALFTTACSAMLTEMCKLLGAWR